MTPLPLRHVRQGLLAFALLAVAACGGTDSASYLASAKSYMAKSDYKAAIIQLKNAIQGSPGNAEVRFLLGKALLESNDPVSAETELRKAIEAKYPVDEAYPALARALLVQGKSDEVVKLAGSAKLETTQGRADLGATLALANLTLGNTKEAQVGIDAVLRELPTDPRALVVKAQLATRDGKGEEAADLIEKALAAAPTDQEALFAKSQLQYARNDRAGATATLQKIVDAHPDSRQAATGLISLQVAARNIDAAQAQLDKLKAVAPAEIGTVYAEALLAMAKDNPQRAKELVQKVLAVAPDNLQALYLSGLADAQLKSYASAEESLRKVVVRLPNDIGTRKVLASTYLRDGQARAALDVLEPMLGRSSDDAEMMRLVAEAYLASGNIAKGGEYYERANRLDKNNVTDKVRLAQVRLAAGDTERGLKDLESLSRSDASQNQSDVALILAHMQRREYDQALAAIAALEKKQPDNRLTPNLRGSVYMARRDFKNARVSFDKALIAQPTDVSAAYNLAMLDMLEGKAEEARKRYEAMITKDPKNEQLLLALAQLTALTRENPEEAKAIIEKAIAANPNSPRARLALIGYYTRLKDTRAALTAAVAAASAFPDDPQVVDNLGAMQLAAGETNQAMATYNRLAQLQPNSPGVLLRVASVQLATKDYAAAIETARKVMVLQPDAPQSWAIQTKAQMLSGQSAAALVEARKLQKDYPNRALGFAIEGELMASEKKWPEAAAALGAGLKAQPVPLLAASQYVALQNAGKTAEATAMADAWARAHPTDTTIAELIAQQMMERKDYPGAIAKYRAILAISPDNATALNNLAWTLSEAGDPKAREFAERAYQQAPFNASVVDTLGWTLFRTGDTTRGLRLLRLASNLSPGDTEIRLHVAQALMKAGDKDGAKRALDSLLKLPAGAPGRAEAEKLLAGT